MYSLLTCYSTDDVAHREGPGVFTGGAVQPSASAVLQCETYLPPNHRQQGASSQKLRGTEEASMFGERPRFLSVAPRRSAEANSFLTKAADAAALFIDLDNLQVVLDSGSTAAISAVAENICDGKILLLGEPPSARKAAAAGHRPREQQLGGSLDAASFLFRSLRSAGASQVGSSDPVRGMSHRRLMVGAGEGPVRQRRRLAVAEVTAMPGADVNWQVSGGTSAPNSSSTVGTSTSTPLVEEEAPLAGTPQASNSSGVDREGAVVPSVSITAPAEAANATAPAPNAAAAPTQASANANSTIAGTVDDVAPVAAAAPEAVLNGTAATGALAPAAAEAPAQGNDGAAEFVEGANTVASPDTSRSRSITEPASAATDDSLDADQGTGAAPLRLTALYSFLQCTFLQPKM